MIFVLINKGSNAENFGPIRATLVLKTLAVDPVFLASFASLYDRNRNRKLEQGDGSRFLLGQNDTVPAVPVPQHCFRRLWEKTISRK
jgi:hypothetical protein